MQLNPLDRNRAIVDIYDINGVATKENGKPTQLMQLWSEQVSKLPPLIGSGSPEGIVSAQQGRIYIDESDVDGNVFYVKQLDEIGQDPTMGWVLNSGGTVGPTGPTGPAGANGTNGTNGTNGSAGATGATGPKGDKGDTGEKGDKGDKGDPGDPGGSTWNSSAGFTLTTYSLISDGSDYPDSFFSGNTSYKYESNNGVGGFCYFELAISQLGTAGDYELLLPINISPAQGSIISQILDSSASSVGYMTWNYLENPFLHITNSGLVTTTLCLFINCYLY